MFIWMEGKPPSLRVQPGCGHITRSNGFDLFDVPKFGTVQQLVEIADHLIQDSQKFTAS
jgi:hypothetical protein